LPWRWAKNYEEKSFQERRAAHDDGRAATEKGMMMQSATQDTAAERRLLWVGLLAVASLLLSGVFACATPFAALAALAALDIERRDGLYVIGGVWLANQIWGYGVLGYPLDLATAGWGIAIGLGAVIGYVCARGVVNALSRNAVLVAVSALLVAFFAYEAVLYAATFAIPGGDDAFSAAVVGRIAAVDAVSFAVLLVAHRLALAAGLVRCNLLEGRAASLSAAHQA
jgi:hypothetical protein